MILINMYSFSVWYVWKLDSWAHILRVFSLTSKPSVTIAELGLPGYLGAPLPPISWRRVEGSVEQVCSRVTVADRLLWEAMTMVCWDILHPIQVT
jgi:hypothetical protein